MANADIVITPGGLIDELEATANKTGATLYNICHRNAGWAIQWHEAARCSSASDDWREGLVIYQYYPTLFEAVLAELARILADQTPPSVQGD